MQNEAKLAENHENLKLSMCQGHVTVAKRPPISDHFFSITALTIFMKLGNYLGIDILRKLTRAFFEKKSGMLIKKLICAFFST